jgi:Tol biopolymer transport system component
MRVNNRTSSHLLRKAAVWLVLPLLTALLIMPLTTASVLAAPGDIFLCSSDSAGTQGNNVSSEPLDISSDGRYIAFFSTATNLVTPATTGQQVFRKDLLTGETRLASCDAAGVQGNAVSAEPSISSDGRYLAFYSNSTNLITGISGTQIYRKDMVTGEAKLVSCDAAGVQANAGTAIPTISSDGQYVAFFCPATNLIPGVTGNQIYRKNLVTGEVKLVSCDAAGVKGNGTSLWPDISSDGRYVSFDTTATNLVTPATTPQQVFRKDMVTGEVKLCSADAAGTQGGGGSERSKVSSDGRYVTFGSSSTNLVTPATTGYQTFRKDLQTSQVLVVSCDATGTQGNAPSGDPAISSDGRYVSFNSTSTNLISGVSGLQAYRKDLVMGDLELVSADPDGTEANNNNAYSEISADGRFVAFWSSATNLIPGVTGQQIYCKELFAPYNFYFAEGYTGTNFQEYLCLGNPQGDPMDIAVTYLFRDGTSIDEVYSVAGNSRLTKNVNAIVGPNKDVSIHCQADFPFVAERPMYFNYGGKWTGGHDAVGATSPSLVWYFAEGYTGPGFDEWVCVLNPGDVAANLTFRFQTQEAGEKVIVGKSVPAHSRQTFMANELLEGGSYQTSLKLESDNPVVAERPIYFNYQGTASWNWTGGSCVMGAPLLSSSYYFAEGTTRSGFEEWLTLQNPGITPINIHAIYYLGSGAPVEKDYAVGAASRATIYVPGPDGVGTGKDVSVLLTCPSTFLAERPMYFNYQGLASWNWTGGHCVIGAKAPADTWFFAEGYTGPNFEEWLCIQNPGASDAMVTITYYPEGGGAPIVQPHNVLANSRFTVPVNTDAGPNLSISCQVLSTAPVIVERPMYFNYNGTWTGGHDVVGYTP